MTGKRGISILDLLAPAVGAPAGAQALIPADLAGTLEQLAVIEHRSTTSTFAHIHYGTLQSLADLGIPGLEGSIVEGSALTQGLPFQLSLTRAPIGTGATLEAGPVAFQLDLFFERLSIRVPANVLRPAKRVASVGATPTYLIPDPSKKNVRIAGSGTIRIASTPAGSVTVTFIDSPDSFDPAAPAGLVVSVAFEPPHFFVAQSEFGLTVDRLTHDGSTTFTPPAIVARGHGDEWRGIAIREATLFFPRNAPLVGDLTVGVRDVLLGSPFGMQGELLIDLGREPVSPAAVTFLQQVAAGETSLAVGPWSGTGGAAVLVTLAPGTKGPVRVRAEVAQAPAAQPQLSASWALPDRPGEREDAKQGIAANGASVLQTRWFKADKEETARLTLEATDSTDTVALPEVSFTFDDPTATDAIPKIDAALNTGKIFDNIVWVSGSISAIRAVDIVFSATPNTSPDLPLLVWDLEGAPTPQSGTFGGSAKAELRPAVPSEPGTYLLTLLEGPRRRRCRINVLVAGEVIIGCEKGVFDKDANPITIRNVEATYALHTFHNEGVLESWMDPAQISSAGKNTVEGSLAMVRLERGTPGNPDATPSPPIPPSPQRHFQVFFEFKRADPVNRAGFYKNVLLAGDAETQLDDWAWTWTGSSSAPPCEFYVIGHCDDIGQAKKTSADANSRSYNRELADERAETAATLLRQILQKRARTATVHARGEQSSWPTGTSVAALDSLITVLCLLDGAGPSENAVQWQAVDEALVSAAELAKLSETKDPEREGRPYLRRVDVFAVAVSAPAEVAVDAHEEQNDSPSLRFACIPGLDLPSAQPTIPREPKLPWLVRLRIGWDSPTAIGLSDFIPTLAEVTVAWTKAQLRLPGTTNDLPKPTSINEVFTIVARWTYDARGGETTFTASLDSTGDPEGIVAIGGTDDGSQLLALALGLGPALAAGATAAGLDGAAVRLAALVALAGALKTVTTSGRVVLLGFEIQQRQRALTEPWTGSRQRILVDYSVAVGFKVDLPGGISLETALNKSMRVRYKNVGIQLDNSKTGLEMLSFVYEDVSFEIEDPGGWKLDGPLGEVLRIVATRAGAGSTWMEIDLAFALDLGVITITGATVRLTFNAGKIDVALRGLSVAIDIPETVRGTGSLKLAPNGDVRAGLDVDIIPVKVKARAALAFNPDKNFFMLDVGVVFATGIPVGNTGLGIFGFTGLFVSNGTRDLSTLAGLGPIDREIGWYQLDPKGKYTSRMGQWALGVGAVIGTMPDAAFTFNALGALTISFPDVSVIFGIDAKFVEQPALTPPAKGPTTSTSLKMLGLVVIDPDAVTIGIRGAYEIPKLLSLDVPAGAYFPKVGDAFVRIGADNVEGRLGDPVQLRLLPDSINVRAWAYLMVEAQKLHLLGNDDRLNFNGFSIGFGSGFGVEWSAGPFRLIGSAKTLVGIGTKPLMLLGAVEIRGELNLVVVSVSVTGSVFLEIYREYQRLQGQICASVDLLVTSVHGCVGISIGGVPTLPIPDPDPLVLDVDLTDRRGIVKGKGLTGSGAIGIDNTVWPDTVPVIHFAHRPKVALDAGSAFSPGQPAAGVFWSGTSELKYAFRLDSVTISKAGAALSGPLDSVWWWPSHRGGVLTPLGTPPSEHEGADLALLSWHPAPWARNLGSDGGDVPSDPAKTVAALCDPVPVAAHVCVLGTNARRMDFDLVRLTPDGPSASPFVSYFEVLGREQLDGNDLATATLLLAEQGMAIVRGTRAALYAPITVSGRALTHGYGVSYVARAAERQTTLAFTGTFAPAVDSPELILELCLDQAPGPSTQTICDEFTDLTAGAQLGLTLAHAGISYQTLGTAPLFASDVVAPIGLSELAFYPPGLRADLPAPADSALLEVAQFNNQPFSVVAYDGAGLVLQQIPLSPPAGVVTHVQLTVAGITRIEIVSQGGPVSGTTGITTGGSSGGATAPAGTPSMRQEVPDRRAVPAVVVVTGGGVTVVTPPGGGPGQPPPGPTQKPPLVLARLCYTVTQQPPTLGATPSTFGASHVAASGSTLPRVFGTRDDGTEANWGPRYTTSSAPTAQCAFVRYEAPDAGPWMRVNVEPWALGHVSVVSVCAVRWDAVQQRADDQANRQQAVAAINDQSGPGTPRPLLDADSEYQIDVTYSFRGWRSASPGETPPVLNGTGWSAAPTQSFRFRTAAARTTASEDPKSFIAEAEFDPRGAFRYLLGFEPNGKGAPHFPDDPVRVYLEVDYLESLLAKYGLNLTLRVRRTDPVAGAYANLPAPPNAPLVVTLKPLPMMFHEESDQRIAVAAGEAPCLDVPALGGTTMHAAVTLESSAEYDVILTAPPIATPTDEGTIIERSHFRTSRYRNARELLNALGFEVPGPALFPPQDVLVSASLPATPTLGSDHDLDAALATLGLDPWPLASVPRVVGLWRNPAAWQLAGVLLEADEPIARPDLLTLTSLTAGSTVLTLVRSNAAATRLLFAAPATMAIAADAALTIVVTPADGAAVTAARALGSVPSSFAVELL